MSSFFSSDGSFSLQFAIIFVVIFLVLAGTVFAFRRLTGKGMALSSKASARGRQPRLGIVDIYELDRQRQLILLRRDNVEHLLLVGGPNDVVIERNINRSIGARLPAEEMGDDEAAAESASALAYEPKPVQAAPYFEPTFEMPVVVPTPPPGSATPTSGIGRPLGESVMSGGYDDAQISEPVQVPQPRRTASGLAGAIRRTPPSIVNLVPGAAAMRARILDAAPPRAKEMAADPVPDLPQPPPVVAPTASRAIDAAILSDMARQLEEALRRPATAVRPAPVTRSESDAAAAAIETLPEEHAQESVAVAPESSDLGTVELEPEHPVGSLPTVEAPTEPHAVDPMAAAMATAQDNPLASENTISDGLFDERELEPESATPSEVGHAEVEQAEIAHATTEPVGHEPSPPVFAEAEPEPAPVEPEPPAAEPAPQPEPVRPKKSASPEKPAVSAPNPFSVEEIEAEFARLLGRPLDRKN